MQCCMRCVSARTNLALKQGLYCNVIQYLASKVAFRPHVVAKGGIAAVVKVMQDHKEVSEPQTVCMNVLRLIGENAPAYCDHIGQAEGVKQVVLAMTRHAGKEDVQEQACQTLFKVLVTPSTIDRALDADVLGALLNLIKNTPRIPKNSNLLALYVFDTDCQPGVVRPEVVCGL
jgi:hypothetical protein